ncbi:MAG: hypothetical protein RL441_35, partial [Actinomycetota bacterium]
MSQHLIKRSAFATWLNSWRLAVRLARRDARRNKARSLLVVVLVALPVMVGSGLDIGTAAASAASNSLNRARQELGTHAGAVLYSTGCGRVWQPVVPDGTGNTYCTEISLPTKEQIQAALPQGARLVTTPKPSYVAMESDTNGIATFVEQQALSESALAGLWTVYEGRLPRSTSEIGISQEAQSKLGVVVGDSVRVTPYGKGTSAIKLDVVGVVSRSGKSSYSVTLINPVLDAPTPRQFWLPPGLYVDGAVPASQIGALNTLGIEVVSREAMADPTAYCTDEERCNYGLRPLFLPGDDPILDLQRVEDWLVVAVVALLVILQVSLVAGPSFAIQLRKRQHDLGLLSSNGASAAALRRTMLASGVFLGVVGATIGVLASWVILWAAAILAPTYLVTSFMGGHVTLPPLPGSLVIVALIGVAAAVTAALIPAVSAGRANVLATLQGRVPQRKFSTRVPLTGLILVVGGSVGILAVGSEITRRGPFPGAEAWLLLCVLIAELGYVLLLPAAVALVGVLAKHAPVAFRLAARDAARHRLRTSAAASAVAAAAAISLAVGVAFVNATPGYSETNDAMSSVAIASYLYSEYSPEGQVVRHSSAALGDALHAAEEAMPGSSAIGVAALYGTPQADSPDEVLRIQCGKTSSRSRDLCGESVSSSALTQSNIMMVNDATQLRALFGDFIGVEQMISVLQSGKAISLSMPIMSDAGSAVDLTVGNQKFKIAAVYFRAPLRPAAIILSPEALVAHPSFAAATTDAIRLSTSHFDDMVLVVVMPANATIDVMEQSTFRFNLELVRAGVDSTAYWNSGNGFDPRKWLWLATLCMLLISLFVGLTVTALAKT